MYKRAVTVIAGSVVAQARRECRTVEQAWRLENTSPSPPAHKRRHKQFFAELLAFFYCGAEKYLRENCNLPTDDLFSTLRHDICGLALVDPIINDPPHFAGDLPDKVMSRYMTRIDARREFVGSRDTATSMNDLLARTCEEIVQDAALSESLSQQLRAVITARLPWSLNELTGAPN